MLRLDMLYLLWGFDAEVNKGTDPYLRRKD